jgi:hypothetical protein
MFLDRFFGFAFHTELSVHVVPKGLVSSFRSRFHLSLKIDSFSVRISKEVVYVAVC